MTIINWFVLWGALTTSSPAPSVRQSSDSALLKRLGDVVNATSDSLEALRGLAQAFRNDLATASPTLVLARATAVHDACAANADAVRRLQGILAARTVSPAAAKSQTKLRTTSEETVAALDRCARLWLPLPRTDERADSLRAWGPYRVTQLDADVRKFHAAQRAFSDAAGLPKPPIKP